MINTNELTRDTLMKLKKEDIGEYVVAHNEQAWLKEVLSKEYKKKDGTVRNWTLMDLKFAFGRKFAPHIFSNKVKKPSEIENYFNNLING